jgi:hypothetical protein
MRVASLCALVALLGCDDGPATADMAVGPDAGASDMGVADGPRPVLGAFTIAGCEKLEFSGDEPTCTGHAPLTVTFVPLSSGVDAWVWTFNGGDPPDSQLITPEVRYEKPGTFEVSLAAGGIGGTTTARGRVVVIAGGLGSPCGGPSDCDGTLDLLCVCGMGECAGGLSVGFCTRSCTGGSCKAGERCIDLTRGVPMAALDGGVVSSDGGLPPGDGGSGSGDGGTSAETWRRAACLPGCAVPVDCRAGLSCFELPQLASGAGAGGAFSWQRACFADVLSDIGESCFGATALPDPSRCVSGRCDDYGARGLCTSGCAGNGDCPTYAACGTFAGKPAAPLCLRRCDMAHPCNDPLLACELPGKPGALGFTVPVGDPVGTTYCAPKRCMAPADCAPAGVCTPMGGGSYCTRS